MLRKIGVLTLAAGLLAGLPGLARADKLDQKLNEQMPEIVKALASKGYKNVGVLRFRAQKGTRPETFSVGPVNGGMAARLESLLVIHVGDADKGPRFGVIRDAGSAAASQKVGTWYTSKAEQNKLFTGTYPLAWGDKMVKADAFLTGKVSLSDDLKTATVTLQTLTAADKAPVLLKTVTAPTDAGLLRDFGFNFALSQKQRASLVKARGEGLDDGDEIVIDQATKQQKVQTEQEKVQKTQPQTQPQPKPEQGALPGEQPAVLPQPDQKPQPSQATPDNIAGIEFKVKSGSEFIPVQSASAADTRYQLECPKAGEPIIMSLKNTTDKRLGVVLKVAGMSTIDKQETDPSVSRKWVIPAGKTYEIKGFYMGPDFKKHLPFAALTAEQVKTVVSQQLQDKAQFIQIDVFDDVEGPVTSLAISRGVNGPKARSARQTYDKVRDELLLQSRLKKTRSRSGEVTIAAMDEKDIKENPELEVVDFAKNPLQLGGLTVRVAPRQGGQQQPEVPQPQPEVPQPEKQNKD